MRSSEGEQPAPSGGCPVDHENMSKEEIAAFMAQHQKQVETQQQQQQQPNPIETKNSSAPACPVDHENMSKEQIAAFMSQAQQASPAPSSLPTEAAASENSSSASTPNLSGAHGTVYDVYGQELDRANMMPTTPNQLPSPGQQEPLSTDRVQSTIPKAVRPDGQSETWTYPSPQMFYNSLHRKGKADGVQESDMPSVVAVHNQMNEQTWEKVLHWESKFHCDECKNPTLKRFLGRPHDLSLAAFFRSTFLGYPRPFDRHDWVVDRCGKEDVRYIIDYYFWEGRSPSPIEFHVRPAVNSISTAYDRLREGLDSFKQRFGLENRAVPVIRDSDASARSKSIQSVSAHGMYVDINKQTGEPKSSKKDTEQAQSTEGVKELPPEIAKGEQLDPEEFEFLTKLTAETVGEISEDVQSRCEKVHQNFVEKVSDSNPDVAEQANVSLNYCMAQRICKPQSKLFMSALESGKDPSDAYTDMTDCLDRFQIMARRAVLEAAGIKQSGPEFSAGVIPSVGRAPNPPNASQ